MSEVRIRDVACGRAHTLLLDAASNVWAAGDTSTGATGVVTPLPAGETIAWTPVRVNDLCGVGVFHVAAGGDVSAAIRVVHGTVSSPAPGALAGNAAPMLFLDAATIEKAVLRARTSETPGSALRFIVQNIFGNVSALAGSFYPPREELSFEVSAPLLESDDKAAADAARSGGAVGNGARGAGAASPLLQLPIAGGTQTVHPVAGGDNVAFGGSSAGQQPQSLGHSLLRSTSFGDLFGAAPFVRASAAEVTPGVRGGGAVPRVSTFPAISSSGGRGITPGFGSVRLVRTATSTQAFTDLPPPETGVSAGGGDEGRDGSEPPVQPVDDDIQMATNSQGQVADVLPITPTDPSVAATRTDIVSIDGMGNVDVDDHSVEPVTAPPQHGTTARANALPHARHVTGPALSIHRLPSYTAGDELQPQTSPAATPSHANAAVASAPSLGTITAGRAPTSPALSSGAGTASVTTSVSSTDAAMLVDRNAGTGGMAADASFTSDDLTTMAPGPAQPATTGALDLDVVGLERSYRAVLSSLDASVTRELTRAGATLLDALEPAARGATDSPGVSRALVAMWMSPVNSVPEVSVPNVARLCGVILALPQVVRNELIANLGASVPGVLFGSRLVKPLVAHAGHHMLEIMRGRTDALLRSATDGDAEPLTNTVAHNRVVRVLRLLYMLNERLANEARSDEAYARAVMTKTADDPDAAMRKQWAIAAAPRGALLPRDAFYCPVACSLPYVALVGDYLSWRQAGYKRSVTITFSLCGYPFLYDAAAKQRLIHIESRQRHEYAVMGRPFAFVLPVRRSTLLTDAARAILAASSEELRRPLLRVVFDGEEAVDEGGLTREFFSLLFGELLQPRMGLFEARGGSGGDLWFKFVDLPGLESRGAAERASNGLRVVGAALGLAFFHGHTIDARFATPLFRKLLGERVGLADLADLDPALAAGLDALLAFEPADDVEATFCLTWEASAFDASGARHDFELVPGGAMRPVTGANRVAYAVAYANWVLNVSVERPFRSLYDGFHSVVGECRPLKLFAPEELALCIRGAPSFDFVALESATTVSQRACVGDETQGLRA